MATLSRTHNPKKQGSPPKAKKPRNTQKYSLLSRLGLNSAEVPKSFDSFCELSNATVPESKYNVSLVKANTNENNNAVCISTISLPFGTLTNFGRGKLFGISEPQIAEEQAELKVVESSDGVEIQLEFRGGVPMAAKFFHSPDCVTLEKHKVYSFKHMDIFFVGPHVFRVEILKCQKPVTFKDNLVNCKDFQSKWRILQQTALQTTSKPSKSSRRKSESQTTPPPSMETTQPVSKRAKECVAPPPNADSSALASSPSSDSSSLEDSGCSLTPSSSDDLIMSRTSSDLELGTTFDVNGDYFLEGQLGATWQNVFVQDYHYHMDMLPGAIGAQPYYFPTV